MFQVEGMLPVALKALDGQTEKKKKKINSHCKSAACSGTRGNQLRAPWP